MSIAEIIPAIQSLTRGEKFQFAHVLVEGLEGQVYPIYTTEYSPGAAAQLAQVLKENEP